MVSALFRIIEPSEGTVIIDSIDIQTLGLDDLRSRLSFIPQVQKEREILQVFTRGSVIRSVLEHISGTDSFPRHDPLQP